MGLNLPKIFIVRRACFCKYQVQEGLRPIYASRKNQGQYSVALVLHGSQYREDPDLRFCLEHRLEKRSRSMERNDKSPRIKPRTLL